MRQLVKIGEKRTHEHTIAEADLAQFESELVHPVCSTFALAREMEWSSRLFVIDMIDDDEEGIGTSIHINHQSPALKGDNLMITATLKSVIGHEIVCDIKVLVKNRLIASGETGQKILKRTKIASLLDELK